MMHSFLEKIYKQLIVSCQALEEEPLHGSEMMGKMALAAKEGGAAAIRCQSVSDIQSIRERTGLPVIGLIKRQYADSPVYITPTFAEVEELLSVQPDVIALDATKRKRPHDVQLPELINYIHQNSATLVLGDISAEEDVEFALRAGVDMIATTLSGYTSYSPQHGDPDFRLVEKLVAHVSVPVIAEGRIRTPEQTAKMLEIGAWSTVVGSAITRPQWITKSFVYALPASKNGGGMDGRFSGQHGFDEDSRS